MIKMRVSIITLLLLVALTSTARAQPPAKPFVNAERIAEWAAWKANYDANPSTPSNVGGQIYKLVKSNADTGGRYSDFGQWPALMYQWTGDSTYVTKAWLKLTGTPDIYSGVGFLNANKSQACGPGINVNYSRFFGWQFVLVYAWLYSGLDSDQRTLFLTRLNNMAACMTADGGPVTGDIPWRYADTDQTVGDYLMVALLHELTTSYNSTINTVWSDATRKWGGYVATAADKTTRRNAIERMATDFAAGGDWCEGAEYNLNTVSHLCVVVKALQDLQSPTDNFSNIASFCVDSAESYIHTVTPGINGTTSLPYQWGDIQTSRTMMNYYRANTAMMLAGVMKDEPTIGPRIQDYTMDYLESVGVETLDPYPLGFFLFETSATRGDHSTEPLTHFGIGQGIFESRTGWTGGDSFFGAQFSMNTSFGADSEQIDHLSFRNGEFQFWKAGLPAISHPITYGGPGIDAYGTNNLALKGLSFFDVGVREYRKVQAHITDIANGFSYVTGTIGGTHTPDASWAIPVSYIMEHTRSFLWLRGLDTIIVHDRTNTKTPPDTSGYYPKPKDWMDTKGLKELYIHMPVSPTVTADYVDWSYSGANHTRVGMLLPTDRTTAIENEVTLWVTGWSPYLDTINPTERKYHVKLTPNSDRQWDTFLNVWDVYNGTPATVTLIQDTTNHVDASLVYKNSTAYLVAFNAIQGANIADAAIVGGFGYYVAANQTLLDHVRLRTSGYTLSFTAPASTTKAILLDLDPNTTWTYKVDGGALASLTVTSDGIGVVSVSGSGAKTLEVLSDGPLPVAVVTPSLPDGRKNQAYSQTLTANGGNGSAYTWTKTAGNLPTSTSLSGGGVISGTTSVAGTFDFTVQACDSEPTCGTRALSILIADLPSITTTSSDLNGGNVDSAYSDSVAGTGGTPPYGWTVVSGSLCSGLSLDASSGAITGIPTQVETCIFTIRLTDDAAATADQAMQIVIGASLPTLTTFVNQGSTSAVVTTGIRGLPANDSCSVDLILMASPNGIISTTTSVLGPATRKFVITGLNPSNRQPNGSMLDGFYGVTASCLTTGTSPRVSFRTFGQSTGSQTVPISFGTPPSILSTAARITVDVDDNEALSSPTSVQNTSCGSGCSVNLSLSAGLYYYRWRWQTAADAVLATSPVQPLVVP